MNVKAFPWAIRIVAVLLLTVSASALAQPPNSMKFRGVLNDFTPASVSGPWEVRGHWSLLFRGASGKADFSAALTMVRSDTGALQNGGDLNNPANRNAHTHHITLVDGDVTPIANGFRVTGTATITANGNYPPPFGPSSTVQIDITGGNHIEFSNIAVTLGGDAAAHFGPNPLHGVVHFIRDKDNGDADRR
jgi:hypothetical protein